MGQALRVRDRVRRRALDVRLAHLRQVESVYGWPPRGLGQGRVWRRLRSFAVCRGCGMAAYRHGPSCRRCGHAWPRQAPEVRHPWLFYGSSVASALVVVFVSVWLGWWPFVPARPAHQSLPTLRTDTGGGAVYVDGVRGDDAHTCTQAEESATPKRSARAALDCMTTPGKTVVFRGGTYEWSPVPPGPPVPALPPPAATGTTTYTYRAATRSWERTSVEPLPWQVGEARSWDLPVEAAQFSSEDPASVGLEKQQPVLMFDDEVQECATWDMRMLPHPDVALDCLVWFSMRSATHGTVELSLRLQDEPLWQMLYGRVPATVGSVVHAHTLMRRSLPAQPAPYPLTLSLCRWPRGVEDTAPGELLVHQVRLTLTGVDY